MLVCLFPGKPPPAGGPQKTFLDTQKWPLHLPMVAHQALC